MYFTPQTPKPGFGPVQSTARNQRASLCLCLLVPWKSFARCLFETRLPSPPTRRSIKSTKTQKAEDTSDEESDETDDDAPVDDESSDESDDDDDEGRYELLE